MNPKIEPTENKKRFFGINISTLIRYSENIIKNLDCLD